MTIPQTLRQFEYQHSVRQNNKDLAISQPPPIITEPNAKFKNRSLLHYL